MPEKRIIYNEIGFSAAIGLNQQMLPVFLLLLLAAAIAWIFVSRRLYVELRKSFPGQYDSLGRPGFFMTNSFTANFKIIRFLYSGECKATKDHSVIKLCQGLRLLLYIYLFCLAGCLVLLFADSG